MKKKKDNFCHEESDAIREIWESHELHNVEIPVFTIAKYRIGFVEARLNIELSEDGTEKLALLGYIYCDKRGWVCDDYIDCDLTTQINILRKWRTIKIFIYNLTVEHYARYEIDLKNEYIGNSYYGRMPIIEEYNYRKMVNKYPELEKYNKSEDDDGVIYWYDITHDYDPKHLNICQEYKIRFTINNKNYEFVTYAWSKNEALGIFFKFNPNITYNMVEKVIY